MRWTEADYQEYLTRQRPPAAPRPVPRPAAAPDRYRSQTERRYAALLTDWQQQGQVRQWWYEAVRLRLADHTTLTPDFLVQWTLAPWPWQVVEVKGRFVREDSWIKLKVAAEQYAALFRFTLAQWDGQQWITKDVP